MRLYGKRDRGKVDVTGRKDEMYKMNDAGEGGMRNKITYIKLMLGRWENRKK